MSGFDFSGRRRLVIKVGSSLLIDADNQLDRRWLDSLADDIAGLCRSNHEVLVVSSGSIAIGSGVLGIVRKRARLEELQAAAAAGQVQLVHAYQESLGRHDLAAAQVLLTPGDTEDRRRFLNARGTLLKLLERNVVPVINENDTVATEEIRYGDNDRLAARVAQLVMADALVLLSDVDGLYSSDPGASPDAEHIAKVRVIDDDMLAIAGETRSDVGTGGMATKVQAARIATRAGCTTVVASGKIVNPVDALQRGARHTVFVAHSSPAAVRKQWLAGVHDIAGELQIDDGAVVAIRDGGSLLPVGVSTVGGCFGRGDVVRIVDGNGREIGRGLAEYAHNEAQQIAGSRSGDIEAKLGYRGRTVMVHHDELVLFDDE